MNDTARKRYSFDLADNDLDWTIQLWVDIPRWPDWKKSLKVLVYPNAHSVHQDDERQDPRVAANQTNAPTTADALSEEITFVEAATHLWQLRDDNDQVDQFVDAVAGLTFDIATLVERRLLLSGNQDPHVYKDGYALWARHNEPSLPLVPYIPHDLADEFEQVGNDLWNIRGTIVRWDHQHGRLQIKVLADSEIGPLGNQRGKEYTSSLFY